jgi:hypothetical protein
VTTLMDFGSKEARDAAVATGMTNGMEQSYQLLDAVLNERVEDHAGDRAGLGFRRGDEGSPQERPHDEGAVEQRRPIGGQGSDAFELCRSNGSRGTVRSRRCGSQCRNRGDRPVDEHEARRLGRLIEPHGAAPSPYCPKSGSSALSLSARHPTWTAPRWSSCLRSRLTSL